jgi:hypothetical protein
MTTWSTMKNSQVLLVTYLISEAYYSEGLPLDSGCSGSISALLRETSFTNYLFTVGTASQFNFIIEMSIWSSKMKNTWICS